MCWIIKLCQSIGSETDETKKSNIKLKIYFVQYILFLFSISVFESTNNLKNTVAHSRKMEFYLNFILIVLQWFACFELFAQYVIYKCLLCSVYFGCFPDNIWVCDNRNASTGFRKNETIEDEHGKRKHEFQQLYLYNNREQIIYIYASHLTFIRWWHINFEIHSCIRNPALVFLFSQIHFVFKIFYSMSQSNKLPSKHEREETNVKNNIKCVRAHH